MTSVRAAPLSLTQPSRTGLSSFAHAPNPSVTNDAEVNLSLRDAGDMPLDRRASPRSCSGGDVLAVR
jgi:hypothetical protein